MQTKSEFKVNFTDTESFTCKHRNWKQERNVRHRMEEGWENLVRTTEKTPTEGYSTLSGAPVTSSHVPLDYSWDSPPFVSHHHEGDKKLSFQMRFCLSAFGARTLVPINKLLKNPAHLGCLA